MHRHRRADGSARASRDRILYGTDFPNIPYAWDRELRILARSGLPEVDLARVLGANAEALFVQSE